MNNPRLTGIGWRKKWVALLQGLSANHDGHECQGTQVAPGQEPGSRRNLRRWSWDYVRRAPHGQLSTGSICRAARLVLFKANGRVWRPRYAKTWSSINDCGLNLVRNCFM